MHQARSSERAATLTIGGDLGPVFRIGYGAMRIVGQPGNWGPPADHAASLRVLSRAVELGVGFIDTADAYGPGVSEELIAEALHPYPEGLVVATKGGIVKTGPTPAGINPDGRPERLRAACEASLRRLRVERIDLYQLHRPDPDVPFAETIGALADLRAAGKVRHLGLCNVSVAQLHEALSTAPIASVQNRYSLGPKSPEAEEMVELCAELGIAFLPWGPLAANPMEQGSPLSSASGHDGQNPVAASLAEIARRLETTPTQVALAWLLHRSPIMLPIPGTTSRDHLAENVAATKLELTAADLTALAPVAAAEDA